MEAEPAALLSRELTMICKDQQSKAGKAEYALTCKSLQTPAPPPHTSLPVWVGTSYMIPIVYRAIEAYSVPGLIVYRGDCLGLLHLLGVLVCLGFLQCLGLL